MRSARWNSSSFRSIASSSSEARWRSEPSRLAEHWRAMADNISWIATIATIIAASMTAANLGSRITGYGFCVFLAGSLSWLAVGLLTGQSALAWTNVILTVLNIFGAW